MASKLTHIFKVSSIYNNPEQNNTQLPCKPADRWLLDNRHRILPMFDPVAVGSDEILIRGATWNVQDPSAARMGNDYAGDDCDDYQSTMQGQICRQNEVPFVLMQETSLASVQGFARCKYGITGQYCTREHTPGNYRMLYNGWGFPGRKSDTPWTDTTARHETRKKQSWWRNLTNQAAESKLDWTGLSIAFDPKMYQLEQTEFRKYNAQRGISSSLHALGVAFGIVDPTDASEGDFNGFKNSSSGVMRTDGVLITKLHNIPDNTTTWLINSHLESFHHQIRDQQFHELKQEIHTLAINNPNDWICFGGDFNRPQSGEEGFDDLYGAFVNNPMFADGRCVGMPRAQIRESFKNEKSLDGLYVIHPKGYHITQAHGLTLIPGCAPEHGTTEETYKRDVSDHCAVTLSAVFRKTDA